MVNINDGNNLNVDYDKLLKHYNKTLRKYQESHHSWLKGKHLPEHLKENLRQKNLGKHLTKKQKNSILMAVALFIGAAACYMVIGSLFAKKTVETIQGDVEVSEYRVSSKVPGRILELKVKEGDYVHVGDTLAILDAPEVSAKQTQALSVENAASAMSQMANNGARQEQIQGAYELWQQAQAGVEIAEKSYNRVQRLYDEGVMTAQKRDEALANYQAMQAQAKAAKSQYDMAVHGARSEEKAAAAAKVNQARGAVQEVRSYMRETIQIAQVEGEVSEVFSKVGELVGTGSPIMNISIMNDMPCICPCT